jgi:NADH-quinone oxidoreductase subunit E
MTDAERKFAKVNEIIKHHDSQVANLIPILQSIQAEYRYLPEEVLAYVATALGVSPATVFGVATFYAQFSLQTKGKIVIKVCNGTSCHVRGSEKLKERLEERLGLGNGKNTTDDMRITLETVSCLGACGLSPVIVINDEEVHGKLTPEALDVIIDQLLMRPNEESAN